MQPGGGPVQFACPSCQRVSDIAERSLKPDRPTRNQCPGCKAWVKLTRQEGGGLAAELDNTAPQPKKGEFAATLMQPQRFDFDLPPPVPRSKSSGFFLDSDVLQPLPPVPKGPDRGQLVQDFSVMFRVDNTRKSRRGKVLGALAALLVGGAVTGVLVLQQQRVAAADTAAAAAEAVASWSVRYATTDTWAILPLNKPTAGQPVEPPRTYRGTTLAQQLFLAVRKQHMAALRAAQVLQPDPAPLPQEVTPIVPQPAKGGRKKGR
jgi:hypothetical protein